jgi:diguanylate cyclase (GGDEF)-like protein
MPFEVPWTRRDRAPATAVRNDLLAGGIVLAAAVLLIPTGSEAVGASIDHMLQLGGGSDLIATTAVLLNIALILFAWRRYRDLRREVEERAAAEARARTLASRDQLTGLLTRASLADAGAILLGETGNETGSAAALVLNLDRFKKVNDVYGHAAGDTVLRAMAELVAASAGPEALCARVGGDEFCILLPTARSGGDAAAELAAQLVRRTGTPVDVGGALVHLSGSVGLSRLEAGCTDIEALLRRADIAMHAAKQAGGSRSLWFDDSMECQLKARNEIEAGLRRGLPAGEFQPFYQPQVDLDTGRLHGFEVLARWRRADGPEIGPELFVPVAEDSGLIDELFERLLARALADARDWDDLVVSVNISPVQLKDPWLAQKILKSLTRAGFPAARLEIEITESALFENLPLAQATVAGLKNQGVKLALDDFGTGYSSLAHLRVLPFDRIKIDRSFVQSIVEVRESLAITTAIARIGESLGVAVTAEGVEDAQTAARLREIGCGQGQGWHFGRPMDCAAAGRLVAAARDPSSGPARRACAAARPHTADDGDCRPAKRSAA